VAAIKYEDSWTISQDAGFRQRVQQCIVEAAVAIYGDPDKSTRRVRYACEVLKNPGGDMDAWAHAVATDNVAVMPHAGSPPTIANITNDDIKAAVSSMWNAVAGQ